MEAFEKLEGLKARMDAGDVTALPFDLILLDLVMPRMDGKQVLHRLKESAEVRARRQSHQRAPSPFAHVPFPRHSFAANLPRCSDDVQESCVAHAVGLTLRCVFSVLGPRFWEVARYSRNCADIQ